MPEPAQDAYEFWEELYGDNERVWSGRVNARLAEVASELQPGSVLDLGCGEGGDAIWLAEHGWRVVAVDISATALGRARAAARERNMLSRIALERHDLSESFSSSVFDLVSAQFLQSPVVLDRDSVLRGAAGVVASGGTLLIVEHGSAPPWAGNLVHENHFRAADEVLAGLQLDDARWIQVRVESVARDAVGPDGQRATVADSVLVLRRTA